MSTRINTRTPEPLRPTSTSTPGEQPGTGSPPPPTRSTPAQGTPTVNINRSTVEVAVAPAAAPRPAPTRGTEVAQRPEVLPQPTGTLRLGDRGDHVKLFQSYLEVYTQKRLPGGTDGVYGRETEALVRDFQRINKMGVDGVAGPETLQRMGFMLPDVHLRVESTAQQPTADQLVFLVAKQLGWGNHDAMRGWIHNELAVTGALVRPQGDTNRNGLSEFSINMPAATYRYLDFEYRRLTNEKLTFGVAPQRQVEDGVHANVPRLDTRPQTPAVEQPRLERYDPSLFDRARDFLRDMGVLGNIESANRQVRDMFDNARRNGAAAFNGLTEDLSRKIESDLAWAKQNPNNPLAQALLAVGSVGGPVNDYLRGVEDFYTRVGGVPGTLGGLATGIATGVASPLIAVGTDVSPEHRRRAVGNTLIDLMGGAVLGPAGDAAGAALMRRFPGLNQVLNTPIPTPGRAGAQFSQQQAERLAVEIGNLSPTEMESLAGALRQRGVPDDVLQQARRIQDESRARWQAPEDAVGMAAPARPYTGPYNASSRSLEQLWRERAQRKPFTGETQAEAATRVSAAEMELLNRADGYMGSLRRERISVAQDEAVYGPAGNMHIMANHGPDIPVRQPRLPNGQPDFNARDANGALLRTLEGRVLHNPAGGVNVPAWSGAASTNAAFKWSNDAVMNRVINSYVEQNWDRIASDLALFGKHAGTFDSKLVGDLTGTGASAAGVGFAQNQAGRLVEQQTNLGLIVIEAMPGDPTGRGWFVKTAYPNYTGAAAR